MVAAAGTQELHSAGGKTIELRVACDVQPRTLHACLLLCAGNNWLTFGPTAPNGSRAARGRSPRWGLCQRRAAQTLRVTLCWDPRQPFAHCHKA